MRYGSSLAQPEPIGCDLPRFPTVYYDLIMVEEKKMDIEKMVSNSLKDAKVSKL